MAEGARLESVYTFIAYRGFESLSLRQIIEKAPCFGAFLYLNFIKQMKEAYRLYLGEDL